MTTRLPLPALVDLPAALSLADMLRAATGSILVDAAAVERIGVPGLQLLLSAQASVHAEGGMFGIERPSEAMRAAIETTGAGRLLVSGR